MPQEVENEEHSIDSEPFIAEEDKNDSLDQTLPLVGSDPEAEGELIKESLLGPNPADVQGLKK